MKTTTPRATAQRRNSWQYLFPHMPAPSVTNPLPILHLRSMGNHCGNDALFGVFVCNLMMKIAYAPPLVPPTLLSVRYRSGNHGWSRCWTCHHHHRNACDGLHQHDQHQACRHAVRRGLQVEHNAAARLLRPHSHGWGVPIRMHPVRPPLCAGTFQLPGIHHSRIVCPALTHSSGAKHLT